MKNYENEIISFVEPIFRFCRKRLNSKYDAEDLASEIIVYILDGVKKYKIDSFKNWVWRIAYNRYARFIDKRNKCGEVQPEQEYFGTVPDSFDFVDDFIIKTEHSRVFQILQSISAEYRNILVDFYVEQLPIKVIAQKYGITEYTVKWRLDIGREKIKTKMETKKMNRIYNRINWNTGTCNGKMNSNKYLFSQIARAICEAAYEKSLTIEEISEKTGLGTIFVEDELPRLISGDAIVQEGKKYATNFIVLRNCDKNEMSKNFAPLVKSIADYFENLFIKNTKDMQKIGFYTPDYTAENLGYIALPCALRSKVKNAKAKLNLEDGPYPPRKDGGYGWFIVEETDDNEKADIYSSGCNISDGPDHIYYYWLNKYFDGQLYFADTHGTCWLAKHKIIEKANNGIIPKKALSQEDTAALIKNNLIKKQCDNFVLNVAVFETEQFETFRNLFVIPDEKLDKALGDLILNIHKSFNSFVPKRLDSQINQWVSGYSHSIIGLVAEELINRKVLSAPKKDKLLTNGIFCIKGNYVDL